MKYQITSIVLIVLFSLTIVFHFLILLEVIPYTIAWGGRLQNDSEMFVFEGVSIALNTLFLLGSLAKYKQIQLGKSSKFVRVMLWIMFALFVLNTIGNLLSVNSFEKIVFTPITIVLAIACFILARKR